MNTPDKPVQPWSRLRWGASIAGVVALHFAILVVLGNSAPPKANRQPATRLILPEVLAGEMQSLTDPTLLAMGGPHGFSSVWMEPTNLPPLTSTWKQDPRWLEMESSQLGAAFVGFARSNAASLHGLKFKAPPRKLPFESIGATSLVSQASTLRVADELAARPLLNPPQLSPQSGADLLLPSEVRVLVDANGIVISAILLPPGSGSKAADRLALEQAKAIRFAPAPSMRTEQPLTFGRLIFDWQTLPPEPSGTP